MAQGAFDEDAMKFFTCLPIERKKSMALLSLQHNDRKEINERKKKFMILFLFT